MNNTSVRRAGVACFAVLALAVLAVPIVNYASGPSGVLEACINPGNCGMRLVDANTPCHNNETRVQWNITGPQGPPGVSAASGPPYVWICSPAYFPNTGSNSRADLYIFNGSGTTANTAVNILNRNGTNLAGTAIPGAGGPTYPGETGATTVAVADGETRLLDWLMPQNSAAALASDVSVTVRVTSDQPVVVASHFQFNPIGMPNQCSLMPK